MRIQDGEPRTVEADGIRICYNLVRKRVKNINLRICEDGRVQVSAPRRVSAERIDAFVASKATFINRAVERSRIRNERRCVRIEDGAQVVVFGETVTVRLTAGDREFGTLTDGVLYLYLRSPDHAQAVYENWKKDVCTQLFPAFVHEIFDTMELSNTPFPTLRFREMSSRWGSCNQARRRITLNTRLLEKPREVIDYVILHELCHLLRADHSPAFYEIVERYMPDYARRRQQLRD